MAASLGVTLGAGLIETDEGRLYNTYVAVNGGGLIAKHRKIHAFINEAITCGDRYTVFRRLPLRHPYLLR